MSRSYTRNLNTASLNYPHSEIARSFQDAKRSSLRRADLRQQSKEICTYCQTRYGFDYYVQPAAQRDSSRRRAKAYVATAED